ncbi:hypothetical protein Tco_0312713 [Tanacetum coccineum]
MELFICCVSDHNNTGEWYIQLQIFLVGTLVRLAVLEKRKIEDRKNGDKAYGVVFVTVMVHFPKVKHHLHFSTNDANTASPQVSAASPNVNAASPQVYTASVSDNTVYAFMVENPNGSNVIHQDIEQIHEDGLEAMDLNWQLSLLRVRAEEVLSEDSKRFSINANDTAG